MKKVLATISVLFLLLTFSSATVFAGKPASDRDGDGYLSTVDCDDRDATINPGATEICDGVDNNCDDVIDEGCGGCTPVSEICDNGIDDDCDDAIDCADSNCTADPACSTCNPIPENCTDGVDNDCDDAVDCADSDCSGDPACSSPHSGLLYQDYPNNCMACHNTQFNEMADALHYTWVGDAPDMTNQPGTQQGKLTNALNSYCINILGDWPVCGSCHVGRGLRPDDAQADNSNIDCLMCHNADYAMARVRLPDGSMGPSSTDTAVLNGYLQNIAAPTRQNCLKCHANAGGGDGIKRGDISMSDITNTDPDFDVHMNMGGANVACQDCHAFINHKVTGKGSDLRATDHAAEVQCTSCHAGMDSGTGHTDAGLNRTDADRHIARVACQACHIDEYGKVPTEIHRDWEFHHDGEPADGVSGPGHPYSEMAANLTPVLKFWNRTSHNALLYETAVLDPVTGTYPTSRPNGDINDGKLYPFKYKTAYQPKTVADDVIISVDTFDFLKVTGDLDTAVQSGLVNMGYPANEPYELITTETYALLNHGIPQAATIDCAQCHSDFSVGSDNKLDLLGYKLKGPKAQVCNQCHSDKKLPRTQDRMHGHLQKGSGIGCGFCHSFERP
ncbi:MopE-related protein [Desulfuromonas sp.]|uniref:MopE-related protein n=1 Tax=Desulfuromonas sp. TaxID=892 RepID=UPI0025C6FB5C|nr:MopE-related protein [Desulfuromonas sp.]